MRSDSADCLKSTKEGSKSSGDDTREVQPLTELNEGKMVQLHSRTKGHRRVTIWDKVATVLSIKIPESELDHAGVTSNRPQLGNLVCETGPRTNLFYGRCLEGLFPWS